MPDSFTRRFENAWPTASLRTYMVAVIVLATLPMAAFMSYGIVSDVRSEQAQTEDALALSAAALAQTVERELVSSLEALTVLSQSELFQAGRIAALGRLLQGRPRRDWDSLFLLDREGKTVLDTASGQTAAQAAGAMRELHQRVLQGGRPALAILPDAAAGGAVAVALPVLQAGDIRYVLGARMGQAVWQRLALGASTPKGGRASLFDAQERLIADSLGMAGAGSALPVDTAQDMQGRPAGVHRAGDVDGRLVYAGWQTVPTAGWRTRVAVPAAPIDSARRKAIIAALSASGASLLLGVALAVLVARRVTAPLGRLASGGPGELPGRIAVREIGVLRDGLLRAREQLKTARDSLHQRLPATDRRRLESQRLMEQAEEAGHVGFFHYEFGADRLAWTPGQCKLFGLERLQGATLRNWFELIASDDRDRVEREFWTACALRRDRQTIDYRVAEPGSASRWLSSRLMLQYDAAGRAAQLTGMTLDMTEHKQLEHERAQLTERALAARREAEAASRAKDEFLTMLSHELRNPLGAISAAIDVLDAADAGSHAGAEARVIIARQTRNLAHMMNDLLDVGRVIAGKILLARQPVNLAAVVRRVQETLAITGEARDHRLQLALDDAWVDGDAVRIEQVVTNLLTNAIKYTPAGRTIEVSVRADAALALLEVQDAGMGIPPALLPHIFDLFVQGERTLDRRAGGLGIGLTLVRRLVELHGGNVGVESSDEGTRFTARFPATAAPQQTDADTLAPSRRRQVLVVEDNGDVLAALRSKLELDGHSVSTAVDGIEGLSRLLKQKPEVSIVDIGLPGLTGFELARHARAAGYAGRMIALSGYGAERDAQEALVAGFDAYLVKPVDRNQLRASLSAD